MLVAMDRMAIATQSKRVFMVILRVSYPD